MKHMTYKKQFSLLVAIFALVAVFAVNASAFAQISDLEVSGVDVLSGSNTPVAISAGNTIPVRVQFEATSDAEDVRVKLWLSGDKDVAVSSERFDVIAGRTYTKVFNVQVPFDLDENLFEDLDLRVLVENRNLGTADDVTVDLTVQREAYQIQILDVEVDSEVRAGEIVALDVVLKNRGSHFAEDSFVQARIPALGIADRAYFGDLSSVDQDNPDKEDAVERRLFLRIPSNAAPGLYTVEVEAFTDDSVTTVVKKVVIQGAGADTTVVAPVHSRSVGTGETAEYSLTLVNAGNNVKVYNLVVGSSSGLTVDVSEPVVAVPAGTSRTVKVTAMAQDEGKYDFTVAVHSGADVVREEMFSLNAEGNGVGLAGNATVLLTVVLAIIFVVLLVVLIVLLTRKPEKSEEFGESYY